jgi:hypothetical protein
MAAGLLGALWQRFTNGVAGLQQRFRSPRPAKGARQRKSGAFVEGTSAISDIPDKTRDDRKPETER